MGTIWRTCQSRQLDAELAIEEEYCDVQEKWLHAEKEKRETVNNSNSKSFIERYSKEPGPCHRAENWFDYRQAAIGTFFVLVAVSTALDAGSYPWKWSSILCGDYKNGTPTDPGSLIFISNQVICNQHSMLSAIAYTVATTGLYHTQRGWIYRDRFLFSGVLSGVITGMGFQGDLYATILDYLPWTVILGLMASHAVRISWYLYARKRCFNEGQFSWLSLVMRNTIRLKDLAIHETDQSSVQ